MWMDSERICGYNWGASLEDFGLIGAAYLLIFILFSIRGFKFLKVVPYLLLK